MDSISVSTISIFTFHQWIIFAYYNNSKITRNLNNPHTNGFIQTAKNNFYGLPRIDAQKKLCLPTLEVIRNQFESTIYM